MGAISKLTGKQEKFVIAYLGEANCNATEAARIAGYRSNGHTLEQVAYENLRKPEIASRIKQAFIANRMTPEECARRVSDMARASVEDIGNVDGGMFFLDLDKAKKRDKLHLISGVEWTNKGQMKVKLHSALDALDKIAKMHGMYKNDEPTVTLNINTETPEQRRQALKEFLMEQMAGNAIDASP